jgi:hypothetical protein
MADTSSYAGDFQLKSVIPDRAQVPTIADSGAILARQKVSIYPKSGQSQTIAPSSSGNPILFSLSDTRAYADLRSANIEMDVTVYGFSQVNNPGTAGANYVPAICAMDESALSLINRIRVLVGGVVAEDIQEVNVISQIKKIMTYQIRNCIDKQIAGGAKYGSDEFTSLNGYNVPAGTTLWNQAMLAGRSVEQLATTSYSSQLVGFRGDDLPGGAAILPTANNYVMRVSIPLRLLSGFFNSKHWFYLRNASVQLELYPETPQDALVQVAGNGNFQAGTATGTAYYAMNNIQLRMDNYILDNSIVEIIDGVIGTRGLVYGFETTTTMVTNFTGSNVSIPFTRAVSDATQFCFVAQPQALSNNYNYYGLTTWRLPGLDNVQLQIGATPMPLNTLSPQARVNAWMQMWNGDGADTLSQTSAPQYALECSSAENDNVDGANSYGPGKLQGIGITLRRTNTEGLFYVNAGYNTALDSGAISLRFTYNDTSAPAPIYTGYAFLQFVRLMTMAGGRISISS